MLWVSSSLQYVSFSPRLFFSSWPYILLKDRLASFTLLAREWRHIKMTKRAGRGHDPGGIAAMLPGGLAVPCRACPLPMVNLPAGWEMAPAETSWLYTLILLQDANFRLKGRMRSSEDKDPALGPGFAYFVHSDDYLQHLSKYMDQDEVSITFLLSN
jgi:hypothetical protein